MTLASPQSRIGPRRSLDTNQIGLTIIIPSWNHRRYLPRCIASAVGAARSLECAGVPVEILAIDDASRDGSQKLLRSFAMTYDHLFTVFLPENHGLPFVRNLGLQWARYRYALLLDSDNEVVAENLLIFVRAIIDTRAALVYGNLLDRSHSSGQCVGLRSNEPATLRLTLGNYIDAFALLDVDTILQLGGYSQDPRLYGLEDWELLLHLIAEEARLVFVPVVMGYYYVNPLSMITEANMQADKTFTAVRRMFAQSGTQEWDPRRVCRIYHPDAGFLDEGWTEGATDGDDGDAD